MASSKAVKEVWKFLIEGKGFDRVMKKVGVDTYCLTTAFIY